MKDYRKFVTMLSTEFHRYLMENEEYASDLPANALVIFQVEGEPKFNQWHKQTSLNSREEGQPIMYVHVKGWRKHSSLEQISLMSATA